MDPPHSVEECKDKDMTYSAPLFVIAEFTNNETGEIKSQTVFMGDFPLMTTNGTFIINGTERVVVSQLVRSPGVYFERTLDKTSDQDIYGAKVIPGRGAWLEFEIDKRDRSASASTASASSRSPCCCARSAGTTPDPRALRASRVDPHDAREGPHRPPRTRR